MYQQSGEFFRDVNYLASRVKSLMGSSLFVSARKCKAANNNSKKANQENAKFWFPPFSKQRARSSKVNSTKGENCSQHCQEDEALVRHKKNEGREP